MANLSRAALLDFLDYLSKKGLVNKATVSARKAAANRVLGILDESEAQDVTQLDINEVMSRFHNLEGANFTPESLSAYKSRIRSAIEDFIRYQADPMSFRPGSQARSRRQGERPAGSSPKSAPNIQEERRAKQVIEPPPTSINVLPIPIRPDLTVKIQGLPYDLTTSEAGKIANVVKAMAIPD